MVDRTGTGLREIGMNTPLKSALRMALGLSWMLPLCAAAQDVPATLLRILPPEALVQGALDDSLELQAARAAVDRVLAEAELRQRGPHEASLTADWLRRDVDQEGRFSEWNLGISQALRWPEKRGIDHATAARMTDLARATAEDVRHQVALDLLQSWMQWRVASDLMRSVAAREAATQREWQAMQTQWQVGQASAAELDALTQLQAEVRAEALVVQQHQQAAESALRTRYPQLVPQISEDVPELPLPERLSPPEEGWWTVVESHSHELEMVRQQMLIADLAANRQAAERRPDPTLGLRVLSERDGAERGVGLTLSIPLGVARRGWQAQQATAYAAELGARLDAEVREMKLALQQREQAANALWQQWQAWQAAALAAETRAERLKIGWELGDVAFDLLLQSRRAAAEARTREIEARAAVHLANAGLLLDAHAFWLGHPSHESQETDRQRAGDGLSAQ